MENQNIWGEKTIELIKLIEEDNTIQIVLLFINIVPVIREKIINGKDDDDRTPLLVASNKGNSILCNLFINYGANVNVVDASGWTPLYMASWRGHNEVVDLLIKNGAIINDEEAHKGRTALYIASLQGHLEVVKLLLDNGAKVIKLYDDDVSALCSACENGHEEVVKLLLANGANVNELNDENESALYVACKNGHEEVVKLLLANDALNFIPGEDVNEKIKGLLEKWPVTMILILLEELKVLHLIDANSLIDLQKYMGEEVTEGGKRRNKKSKKNKKKSRKNKRKTIRKRRK